MSTNFKESKYLYASLVVCIAVIVDKCLLGWLLLINPKKKKEKEKKRIENLRAGEEGRT